MYPELYDLLARIATTAAERERNRAQPPAHVSALAALRLAPLPLPQAPRGSAPRLAQLPACPPPLAAADAKLGTVLRSPSVLLPPLLLFKMQFSVMNSRYSNVINLSRTLLCGQLFPTFKMY